MLLHTLRVLTNNITSILSTYVYMYLSVYLLTYTNTTVSITSIAIKWLRIRFCRAWQITALIFYFTIDKMSSREFGEGSNKLTYMPKGPTVLLQKRSGSREISQEVFIVTGTKSDGGLDQCGGSGSAGNGVWQTSQSWRWPEFLIYWVCDVRQRKESKTFLPKKLEFMEYQLFQ